MSFFPAYLFHSIMALLFTWYDEPVQAYKQELSHLTDIESIIKTFTF